MKNKHVMVTGANGYLASWIVKELLEQGTTVHAAVRNPDNDQKIGHLKKIAQKASGKLKFFKSDLLQEDSYMDAMKGCEIVFHTASPFITDVKDAQKELVDPALLGTKNVLHSANKVEEIKKVVLTSSCAAIFTDATECKAAPNGMLNESIWNKTASLSYQPYYYSKTLAELKAWEIAENQDRWQLITINPSLVLGPPLNPLATTSESFNILKQLGDGTFKSGAPKLGIGVVDVRDVASAHIKAASNPNATGRYITSAYNTNLLEVAKNLQFKYGKDYPIPNKALPKWLLMVIGPMLNKALTRRFIRNNVNVEWKANNSKIVEGLGVQFRPLQETMEDAFQSLIDAGVLVKK